MSKNIQKDPQAIPCDMCTGEHRKPAQKTCMKCEISMCVQHLQAHLTTPVLLQTHPLTEPMALCGTTKCPQHGKLVEYYCLDDFTCVCVSCAIEDQHRLHNMKTFSTAHKELMEKLNAEQQALLVKTDDENLSLEKWEKSEREKVSRSSVRLIAAVTSLRDIALTSVQSSVSARMVSIKTSKSSMQAAQNEKDSFRFLQMYSQVHQDVEKAKAVDLRKGMEPESDRDKVVQEIRENSDKMMKQAGHFLGSLLTLVDPENHQELDATSSDLIFDPKTLDPGMSLSKDKRRVFYSSWLGQCFATLHIHNTRLATLQTRNTHPATLRTHSTRRASLQTRSTGHATLQTHNTQSLPNIQRWMVSLSQDFDWTIGLFDKQYAPNVVDGHVYGLCCKGNQLSSLTMGNDDCSDAPINSQGFGMMRTISKPRASSAFITYQGTRPEMVEMVWNRAASSLSFFSRTGQHQLKEIITIKMSLKNLDLAPFVQLGTGDKQNVALQRQAMVNYGYSPDRCWCYQSNCTCGALTGDGRTTEMVCELQ